MQDFIYKFTIYKFQNLTLWIIQECPSAGEDSDQVEETAMKVRAIIGNNIISMFSDAKLNSLQMKNFIRQPKVSVGTYIVACIT